MKLVNICLFFCAIYYYFAKQKGKLFYTCTMCMQIFLFIYSLLKNAFGPVQSSMGRCTLALKPDWIRICQCNVHETCVRLVHTGGYAQGALFLHASYMHFTCN